MRQWQCPCGAWVDNTRGKHIHLSEDRAPGLSEMIAARAAGREETALLPMAHITAVQWQPHFPRRTKPNE